MCFSVLKAKAHKSTATVLVHIQSKAAYLVMITVLKVSYAFRTHSNLKHNC